VSLPVRAADIVRARNGDETATRRILDELRPMIVGVAHMYFAPGLTLDDLRQEATIGVWEAIVGYQPGAVPFGSFAELCARRKVITAVKTATRMKHGALNQAARHAQNDEGEVVDITDLCESGDASPLERMEMREDLRQIGRGIRVALTRDEAAALILFSAGASYRQIVAATTFPTAKSVGCLTCRRPRHPERSLKYAREIAERDPWCSRTCAEAWHATHRVGAA
jgi:RNA polymerase sporulation-specific sigma factor